MKKVGYFLIFFTISISDVWADSFFEIKSEMNLKNNLFINGSIDETLTLLASANYQWNCSKPTSEYLDQDKQVVYHTMVCSGTWPQVAGMQFENMNIKNLTVHAVVANTNQESTSPLITADIDNRSQCTNPTNCRSTLLEYVQQYNRTHAKKVFAAINGGYFFMHKGFIDSNCIWKTPLSYLFDFNKPLPTDLVGDGLTIIDGRVFSYNCQATGDVKTSPYRATWVVDRKNRKKIINMPTGNKIDTHDIQQALGAGPMMVQNGKYAMEWQLIPSTFEYSANTALALAKDKKEQEKLIFFTVDGEDGKNGMYSFEVANFIKDYLSRQIEVEILSAMSMDQGKSTSLVICPQTSSTCRLVSNAGDGSPGRAVYNGLALLN